MQTFIQGTSFDAINSMAVNYVMDVLDISGTGSKSYPAGCTYQASLIIESVVQVMPTTNPYQINISGNTVSWDVATPIRLVVFASPNTGRESDYYGFSLYSYDGNGNRTIKLAPDFTPFCLVSVIDVPPGSQNVQSPVPIGQKIVTFIRARDGDARMPTSFYQQYNAGGYHGFSFVQTGGMTQTGCRMYIFSNYLVNIPTHGFFLYRDGAMVWHSNCLPLNMRLLAGDATSAGPMAVTPGITSGIYIPQDPSNPQYGGYLNMNCSSAGISNGVWKASSAVVYSSRIISSSEASAFKPWAISGRVGLIDCSIYDQYYPYALGLV